MDLRNNDNVNHRFLISLLFVTALPSPFLSCFQTPDGSIVRFGWFLAAAVRGSGHPKLERTRGGCSLEGGVGKGEIHDVNFNLIKA